MSTEVTVSFDAQLEALRDVDRRRLLRALLNAEEADLPIGLDQPEYETAERGVLVSLQHVHLPKLEDPGFVDVNLDQHSVTRGPRFDEIEPLLELLETNRDRLPADWV
jgi:hypothetical protein